MDMWKKLIAPVVIVILLVAYLLTIGGWFLFFTGSGAAFLGTGSRDPTAHRRQRCAGGGAD